MIKVITVGVLLATLCVAGTIAHADSTAYIPLQPLQYAGETCVPAGNINTVYTYPDGIHPLSTPADPSKVATYKSGQQQIQQVIEKMQNDESVMAAHHTENTDPYQSNLNQYIRQYNDLLSEYDTCS
jgi:hypothetical protein